MRKMTFENDSIYHVYNRGVDKRTIFTDNSDYFRFVHDLYEFNDTAPAENLYYKQAELQQSYEIGSHKIKRAKDRQRSLLVNVLSFCLMPNHFHLLLRQRKNEGVQIFMQKLGIGYAKYFNTKHERSGTLFQGRFKAVLIDTQEYLNHISFYIHANPIELADHNWKKGELTRNKKEIMNFLESYRWSSYPDYIGKRNFPSVTQRDFLTKYLNGPAEYKKQMFDWISEFNFQNNIDLADIKLDE